MQTLRTQMVPAYNQAQPSVSGVLVGGVGQEQGDEVKRAPEIREAMRSGAQLAIARDGYVYLLIPEKVDGRSVRSMQRSGEVGHMSIEDLQRTWLRFFGHREWEG